MTSRAFSCVSVSARRTRTLVWSSTAPVYWMLAFVSVSSTRDIAAASTFTVALPLDTCTAGDSPKKFGSV